MDVLRESIFARGFGAKLAELCYWWYQLRRALQGRKEKQFSKLTQKEVSETCDDLKIILSFVIFGFSLF